MKKNTINRYRLLAPVLLLGATFQLNAALTIEGSPMKVIVEKGAASTGLNDIFVVYDTEGCSATYTSSTGSAVKWYSYGNLGGGHAEEITDIVTSGNRSTLTRLKGDTGYIIEDGTSRYYFWVVDYKSHRMTAESLIAGPDQECDMASLIFSGNADRITYYTINGRAATLDRDITIGYNTLEYNSTGGSYTQVYTEKSFTDLSTVVHVTAPYCNTTFTLRGDRFLREWNEEEQLTSPSYDARAITANTSATQDDTVYDNQKDKGGEGQLGGSAPAEIEFTAQVTDAAIFNEWQFSRTADFEDITLRINDLTTTYTFRDQGTYYIRFVAANADATCEYTGETYTVNIGESALECPNAFSPGASEGVNDEWKVSYKSIIEFDCHIFNRWGHELAHLTHPSQGWDGKSGGKLVPAGVYFYVIKAKGSDGKEYKLSGDINIINYK